MTCTASLTVIRCIAGQDQYLAFLDSNPGVSIEAAATPTSLNLYHSSALHCDPTVSQEHFSPVLWPQLHPLHSHPTPARPALSGCSGCCQRQPGHEWL